MRIAGAAAVIGLLAIVASCGEQSLVGPRPAAHPRAMIAIAPRFDDIPSGGPVVILSKVKGLLIGSSGDTLVTEATFQGDTAVLSFDVEFSGTSATYTLVLFGYDANGVEAYTATEPVTVKAGETPTVTQPEFVPSGPDASLASIKVAPTALTLNSGATGTFTVGGTDSKGQPATPLHIGWHSSDPSIATVDDSGAVIAGPSQGTAWIVAETVTNLRDSALVTVHAPVAQVVVTPASATIIRGQSTSATAVLQDAGGHVIDDRAPAWASSNTSVATVSATGAIQGTGVGTATITASAEGKAGSLALTVQSPVDHVTIAPTTAALTKLHQTVQLQATIVPRTGASVSDVSATYTSSAPNVASVDASSGLVTANGNGTTNITADADGQTAVAVVTVKLEAVAVTITPDTATLTALGATTTLAAHATDALGGTVTGAAVTLSSSAPTVASVDSNGVVTAHANGTAVITATSGSFTATATITVKQAAARITVTPATAGVNAIGDSRTFSATSLDANGNAMPAPAFAWSSSDPTIATIDQTGAATGKKSGTVTITASADGHAGTATFQVIPVPVGIVVTTDSGTLNIGGTTTAHAQLVDRNGNPLAAIPVTWSAAPSGIVTIDQSGSIVAVGAGTATITASGGGLSGSNQVVVLPPPGGGLTLNVTSVEKLPGGTEQFSVTAGGTGPFTWYVNNVQGGNATYGTISATGFYTAPSTVPSPATFQVCARVVTLLISGCAQVTISPIPSAGADVVVINDLNAFDDYYGAPNAGNRQFWANLVTFSGTGPRASGHTIELYRGKYPPCGDYCSFSVTGYYTQIAAVMGGLGYTGVDVPPGTPLDNIPDDVKFIALVTPTQYFSIGEINLLKQFAAQGGRILYIGEYGPYDDQPGYFSLIDIDIENTFLGDMGAVMRNSGGNFACTSHSFVDHIYPHELTQNVNTFQMACASELTLGPNDYALFSITDDTGEHILGGVAKVDLTLLQEPTSARRQPLTRSSGRATTSNARMPGSEHGVDPTRAKPPKP